MIDISTAYAGPYAAMMLADMGADVVKVERPGAGDESRGWGSPFVVGESAWFLSANRNKRSVTLDVRHPRGKEILLRLVAGADVFIENLRPAALERSGLSYADLEPHNPRLIYCAISGFGQTGPDRNKPGYDLIAQALGGIMSVTGETRPQRVGTAVSDITTGLLAAFAIVSALHGRQAHGRGEFIDVSLLDAQMALMAPRMAVYLASGIEPRPCGGTDSAITIYQAVPTADREIVVATGNDGLWARFCGVLGRPDLVADPSFCTNAERSENKAELLAVVETILRAHPADHWLEQLAAAGVPAAPVRYLSEVVTDPQINHRRLVREVEHPVAGPVRIHGVPWQLRHEGDVDLAPPPALGQHTDAVLAERLGLGLDEISRLRAEGIV